MRRALVTALALCAGAAVAPSAQAHPNYDYRGGCFFVTANDELPGSPRGGRRTWSGVAGSAVVAMRDDGVRPAPTAAIDITCSLYMDGDQLNFIQGGGLDGAFAGAIPVSFEASRDAVISMCAVVTVEGEVHEPKCSDGVLTPVVPEPVVNVLDLAHGAVHGQVCYALGILAPGRPGVVDVAPEGDVFVGGSKVYDCAPHDEPPAPQPANTALRYLFQI